MHRADKSGNVSRVALYIVWFSSSSTHDDNKRRQRAAPPSRAPRWVYLHVCMSKSPRAVTLRAGLDSYLALKQNALRWWRALLGLQAARPFQQVRALDDAIRPRETTLSTGNSSRRWIKCFSSSPWPPPRSLASTTIQIRHGGLRILRRKSTRADRINREHGRCRSGGDKGLPSRTILSLPTKCSTTSVLAGGCRFPSGPPVDPPANVKICSNGRETAGPNRCPVRSTTKMLAPTTTADLP
jgi:hypothetical protein